MASNESTSDDRSTPAHTQSVHGGGGGSVQAASVGQSNVYVSMAVFGSDPECSKRTEFGCEARENGAFRSKKTRKFLRKPGGGARTQRGAVWKHHG